MAKKKMTYQQKHKVLTHSMMGPPVNAKKYNKNNVRLTRLEHLSKRKTKKRKK